MQIGGRLTVANATAAGQTGTILMRSVIASGPVIVLGGDGDDTLTMDDSAFLRSFTADLGAGADQFKFEPQFFSGSSTFFAPVLLRGGSGADMFLIGGNTAGSQAVIFKKAVVINGGTETDIDTIGTQVVFDAANPLIEIGIP